MRSVACAGSFTATVCETARVGTPRVCSQGTGHTNHTTGAQWNARQVIKEACTEAKDHQDTFLSEKGKV